MNVGPEAAWVIVGSSIGALIAGLSQILSSWLQWKREEKATRRAELTRNAYVVQDEVLAMQIFVEERIVVKNDPLRPYQASELFSAEERKQIETHSRTLKNLSIRVGDLPLTDASNGVVKHLADALGEGSRQVREDRLLNAKYSLLTLQLRIRQLLHTDVETATGEYGLWPFSVLKQRRAARELNRIQFEVDKVRGEDENRYKAHQDVLSGRAPINTG